MQKINQSGTHILNLVTNMLEVQKFEEQEVQLNTEEIELSDLVKEAQFQMELLAHSKQLKIETTLPESLKLHVDKELMIRVLVNLLTNAVKYSPVGGSISLTGTATKNESATLCQLSIADQGEGIKEVEVATIFDRYYQGNSKPLGVAASTGLGLTFCKLAVEAHKGELTVTSTYGQGSTFSVILPLHDQEISEESKKIVTSHSEHIQLLKHDKEKLAKYSEELLKLEVYHVGKLSRIFAELEKEDINEDWVQGLEIAVQNGDKERYDELLSELRFD